MLSCEHERLLIYEEEVESQDRRLGEAKGYRRHGKRSAAGSVDCFSNQDSEDGYWSGAPAGESGGRAFSISLPCALVIREAALCDEHTRPQKAPSDKVFYHSRLELVVARGNSMLGPVPRKS